MRTPGRTRRQIKILMPRTPQPFVSPIRKSHIAKLSTSQKSTTKKRRARMRKILRKSCKLSLESLAQRLKAEQADESGASPISFWSWLMYNPSVQTHSFAPRFATPQIQNSQVRLMLIRKSLDVLRAMFIGSLLFTLPYGAFAQDQKQPSEKPPAKKTKACSDSCDGALDIV